MLHSLESSAPPEHPALARSRAASLSPRQENGSATGLRRAEEEMQGGGIR